MANENTNKKQKLHIRKDDLVQVITGTERGKQGRVLRIVSKKDKFTGAVQYRAVVEGLNMVTKHKKPDQKNPQGAIVEMEGSIHVSNLMLVDPKTKTPTRIGRQKAEKGWVRISKKSGEKI